MTNLGKRIELLANILIIVVASLVIAVLVKSYFFSSSLPNPGTAQIQAGSKLVISELDWSKSDKTLLLAISENVTFVRRAPVFINGSRRSELRRDNVRLVAVLPQEIERGQTYLRNLGVAVDEVRQMPLATLGVTGTPTLIMVNKSGIITNIWLGKLPVEKEAEVFSQL